MSIEEKIALLKYTKRDLRDLLNEDKYLEIDFIANELGVNKKDVLEVIKNLVSEKGKERIWMNKYINQVTKYGVVILTLYTYYIYFLEGVIKW